MPATLFLLKLFYSKNLQIIKVIKAALVQHDAKIFIFIVLEKSAAELLFHTLRAQIKKIYEHR